MYILIKSRSRRFRKDVRMIKCVHIAFSAFVLIFILFVEQNLHLKSYVMSNDVINYWNSKWRYNIRQLGKPTCQTLRKIVHDVVISNWNGPTFNIIKKVSYRGETPTVVQYPEPYTNFASLILSNLCSQTVYKALNSKAELFFFHFVPSM